VAAGAGPPVSDPRPDAPDEVPALPPVTAGVSPRLDDAAARPPAGLPERRRIEAATAGLLDRLAARQAALHADGRRSLLLVLQGRDASGKDGTIRAVVGACNPMGVQVSAFGPPSARELAQDFLWRVHQVVPPRGQLGVFNRSHYEDVLVVRVRGLAPPDVWQARFRQINEFERLLVETGTTLVKCCLHISRAEQRRRFEERLADPRKNWKFRLGDLEDRDRWDAFTAAYEEALARTSTPWAPWHVVPADDKKVRNALVARLLVDALEAMDLAYPRIDPAVAAAARGFA
jgi:PPK2 family polyphosphate:nucleotide phosphotransferase